MKIKNISLAVVLAAGFLSVNTVSADASGSLTGFVGSVAAVGDQSTLEVDFTYMLTNNLGKIVEAGVLPPTLTLQYHFSPTGKIRPYAGIGVNYTFFYDEDASVSYETVAGTTTSVDLDDSWVLAFSRYLEVKG